MHVFCATWHVWRCIRIWLSQNSGAKHARRNSHLIVIHLYSYCNSPLQPAPITWTPIFVRGQIHITRDPSKCIQQSWHWNFHGSNVGHSLFDGNARARKARKKPAVDCGQARQQRVERQRPWCWVIFELLSINIINIHRPHGRNQMWLERPITSILFYSIYFIKYILQLLYIDEMPAALVYFQLYYPKTFRTNILLKFRKPRCFWLIRMFQHNVMRKAKSIFLNKLIKIISMWLPYFWIRSCSILQRLDNYFSRHPSSTVASQTMRNQKSHKSLSQ